MPNIYQSVPSLSLKEVRYSNALKTVCNLVQLAGWQILTGLKNQKLNSNH